MMKKTIGHQPDLQKIKSVEMNKHENLKFTSLMTSPAAAARVISDHEVTFGSTLQPTKHGTP